MDNFYYASTVLATGPYLQCKVIRNRQEQGLYRRWGGLNVHLASKEPAIIEIVTKIRLGWRPEAAISILDDN